MGLTILSDLEQKIAYGAERLSAPRDGGWSQQEVLDTRRRPKCGLGSDWPYLLRMLPPISQLSRRHAWTFEIMPIAGVNRFSPLVLNSLGVGSSCILSNLPAGIAQVRAILGIGLAGTKQRIGNVDIALLSVSRRICCVGYGALWIGNQKRTCHRWRIHHFCHIWSWYVRAFSKHSGFNTVQSL